MTDSSRPDSSSTTSGSALDRRHDGDSRYDARFDRVPDGIDAERLALAIDGAQDGVWDWQVQTGAVHFDARWFDMLGYEPGEVEPDLSTWAQSVHPDDLAVVMHELGEHLEGRTPKYETEHRVRRKDGSWAWILDRGKVVERDADGHPIRAVGIYTDITARREMAEAMRESERRAQLQLAELEAAYRAAPVGLGYIDRDLRYVRVNERLAAMNGHSVAEHIGNRPGDLVPTVAQYIEPLLRDVLQSGQAVRDLEMRAALPSDPGVLRDWLVNYEPVRAPDGEIVGVNAAIAEITAQKKAEAAVRESQRRYELALRGTGDGVWDWNVGETGAYLSHRFKEILGYENHEFPDSFAAFEESVHPDERRRVMDTFAAHLRGEAAYDVEFRARTKTGDYVWVRSHGEAVRDDTGSAVRVVGALSDISARRAMDAQREELLAREAAARIEADAAHQAAAEANRVKSDFIATMSHELRTPLNAIAGHVQLLEMEVHGPLSDAQTAALARIDRAQRHLLRLVNDVLNFSRLKAGRLDYTIAPVRWADVVAEVEPMIYPQLALKGVSYVVKVPADCVVQGDFEKLVQVLLNLVSNAVKFTPQGGVVSVECARRSGENADGPIVHVRVRDTGPGIPGEKLNQIFEPFVQIDANAATRSAGTGLGLAISRDLMLGMGGELRARSALGEGSTFTISLPRGVAT